MRLEAFRLAKIGDKCVGVPVPDTVYRLEPLNLLQVFLGDFVFEKFKPVSDRLAVSLFDRREVRRWSLNFVAHQSNITERVSGCAYA